MVGRVKNVSGLSIVPKTRMYELHRGRNFLKIVGARDARVWRCHTTPHQNSIKPKPGLRTRASEEPGAMRNISWCAATESGVGNPMPNPQTLLAVERR